MKMDSYTFSSDSTSSFFVKETTSDDNNVVDGSDLTGSIVELNNENQFNEVRNEIVINNDAVPISENMIKIENFDSEISTNLRSNGIFVITVDDTDTSAVVDSKLDGKNDSGTSILNSENEKDDAEKLTSTGEGAEFENKIYLNPCDVEIASDTINGNVVFNSESNVPENEESIDDKNSDKFDMEHFLSFKSEKNKSKESNVTNKGHESNTVLQKYFTEYDSNSVKCNLCSDLLIYQGDMTNLMLHLRLIHKKNKRQMNVTKNSKVWNYFTKLEPNKVKCNLCSCCVIYKKKVSNLIKHLRITHADIKFLKSSASRNTSSSARNDKEESISDAPSSDVIVIQNSQGKLLNQIKINKSWKCFTKLPNSDKMICNICKRIFTHNKTHDLLHHLHVEHKSLLSTKNQVIQQSINDMKILSDSESTFVDDSKPNVSKCKTENMSNIKRKILEHFTVCNGDEICCNDCGETLIKYTASHLLHHLNLKHPDVYKEFLAYGSEDEIDKLLSDDSDIKCILDSENNSSKELNVISAYKSTTKTKVVSDTWNHFTKIKDVGKVKCNYCDIMLKYTVGISCNLTRHLRLKHKDVYNKKMNINVLCVTKESSKNEEEFVIDRTKGGAIKISKVASIAVENNDSESENASVTDERVVIEKSDSSDLDYNLRYDENTSLKVILNDNTGRSVKTKATSENSEAEIFYAKRKSKVWNYFAKLSSGRKVRCNLCSEKFLFNSSSTNRLLHHLSSRHDIHFMKQPRHKVSTYEHNVSDSESIADKYIPDEENKSFQNNDSNSDESSGGLLKDDTTKNEVKVNGRTWKNFTKLDRDKAKCNICYKILTYKLGQTSNLIKHLQLQHKSTNGKSKANSKETIDNEGTNTFNTSESSVNPSINPNLVNNKNQIISKYFSKLEDSRVMCNLCEFPNIYSYNRNSRGNLIRHLNVKHKYILDLELNENNNDIADQDISHSEKSVVEHNDSNASEDSESNFEGSNNNSNGDYKTELVFENNCKSSQEVNMKSLYEYLICDEKLKKCIKYEDDEIKCKICSGSFLCEDLVNYEYSIRYHVQIFHAEWTVLCSSETIVKRECVSPVIPKIEYSENAGTSNSNESSEMYESNYNELEAIANEVNSFMDVPQAIPDDSVTELKPKSDDALKRNDSDDEIWKYFTKLTSQNVRCNYCSTLLSYRSNKKWNLYRHLKNTHGKFKNKMSKQRKKKIPKKAASLLSRTAKSTKQDSKNNYNSDNENEKVKNKESENVENSADTEMHSISSPSKKINYNVNDSSENKITSFSSTTTPVNRKIGRTWSHFTKIDVGKANCNICNDVLKYRGSGIDILNDHLSAKHSDNFNGGITSKEQHNSKPSVVSKRRVSRFKENDMDEEENDVLNESPTSSDKEDVKRRERMVKKNTNNVWQYYTKLEDGCAKCHLCLTEILYRSTTTLLNHLRRMHSVVSLLPIKEKESFSKQESEKSKLLAAVDLTPAKSQTKNHVCFIRFSNILVRCKFCSRVIVHKNGNMHKLMSHLLFKHRNELKQYKSLKNVAFVDNGDEIILIPSNEKHQQLLTPLLKPLEQKVKIDKRKRFRSSSWLYFTKLNEHYAQCNICNNKFSYKGGSIYNLTRHLFTKHEIKLIKRFDTRSDKVVHKFNNNPVLSKPLTSRKKRETLLFYKKVNRYLVRCKLCLKRVMYNGVNISHLINHLWSSHITKLIGFDDLSVSTFNDFEKEDDETGLNDSLPPVEETFVEDETLSKNTTETIANGKRASNTWNYFKCLDDNEKNMQCNICNKKFIYKAGNLSNLSRHLKKSHNIKKNLKNVLPLKINAGKENTNVTEEKKLWPNNMDDDQFKFPFTIMYNKEKDKLDKDKDHCILSYFTKENENKEVTCNICSNVFEYNSNNVVDLEAHLSLKHDISEFSSVENGENMTSVSDSTATSKSTNTVTVSDSSDKVIQNTKMSKMKCKLCYKEVVCRQNKVIYHLIEHLKNLHFNDLQDSERKSLSAEPCNLKEHVLKTEINKTIENNDNSICNVSEVSTSEVKNNLNNLKVKQIVLRYFKNLNSFKNKCKICYKYISDKIPCYHRITNDLLIKYGIKRVKGISSIKGSNEEKRIKMDEEVIDLKESTVDADIRSKQRNDKSVLGYKLKNFMDVNLYENKCYECNYTFHHFDCCIHLLNLWLANESKKSKQHNNMISSDCSNQFSINNEVQFVDTLQKNQNNIIIITGNEDSSVLNYNDIANRNGNMSQDISYHIMNSINDIDDEDIKVIIYNYNSENTVNEKNCDTVKISEVTDEISHTEETTPLKDASGQINHIVEDLGDSTRVIYSDEKSMLNEENSDVTSTVIRQEIVESTSTHAAVNEDNCVTVTTDETVIPVPESRKLFDMEKLTELAEVSCNEQFYKQSSLARFAEQSVMADTVTDSEVVIHSTNSVESADRSNRCIVENIYPSDKIEGYSNNISIDETHIRQSVVEQADCNYGDEINRFNTKENLQSVNNVECTIDNTPLTNDSQLVDETVQTYVKEDENNKPNDVFSDEVINAIFNEVIVNFQETPENEAIKFNNDNIIIPSRLHLQKLNCLYKVSKNILHFTNINFEYKTSKCNLCDIYFEFSEPIIYNLLMHLFTNHKDKILVEESINKKLTKDNKDSNTNEKHRRKSPVWKYFVNDKNFRANCKICNFSFSYKGGAINNLSRHLRLRHGIIVTAKNADESCKTIDFMINYPKRRTAVKLRSRTWNYFSKEPNDWAKCRICKKYLSYRSSTINNLTRHMRTIHSKMYNSLYTSNDPFCVKNEDGTILENFNFDIKNDEGETMFTESENTKTRDEILQQCSYPPIELANSKRKSIVWNYFTESSQNCGKCNFCGKVISCKGGGTSNLSRHLRSKHGIWIVLTSNLSQTFSESMNSTELRQSLGDVVITQNADGSDTIITQEQLQILKSKKLIHKKSKTWEYFTKESNDRVRCNLCSKPLSYKCKAVHNLRRHLAKKHPAYVVKQEPIRLKLEINAENDVLHNSHIVETTEINESNKKFIDITDTSVVIVDEENRPPPHRPDRNTRPKKSVVWNYFEELEYGVAKCLMCFKILSFRGGGTNNLMRHLRCRHSIIIVNNGNTSDAVYDAVDSEFVKESSVTNDDVDKDNANTPTEVTIAGHVLTEVYDQPVTEETNDAEMVNVS